MINEGGARAHDILQLIGEVQAAAKQKRGIDLQTEVQIVGVDDE
jgi:UDP-N-acetylenolpyruvoylglucosamine reductase